MSAALAYEAVIGLEVHAQLLDALEDLLRLLDSVRQPAEHAGVSRLPGASGRAPGAQRAGCARSPCAPRSRSTCEIRMRSVFARKNYFYPDLPKGYQISQYDEPISEQGWIELAGDDAGAAARRIRIERLHLEEDAGKSFHPEGGGDESLDRSQPVRRAAHRDRLRARPAHAREAAEYVARLKELVEFTEVSDGNMEEGSLRCDVNVSRAARRRDRARRQGRDQEPELDQGGRGVD